MVGLSAIPVLVVGLFTISHMRQTLRERVIERIQYDTSTKAHSLEVFLQELHRDLRVLSQLREVRDLAVADAAADPAALAAARSDAEREFAVFSQGRRGYRQLRYLNGRAEEVMRLDVVDGQPRFVRPEELSTEIDAHYLNTALTLEPGQIYISEGLLSDSPGLPAPNRRRVLSCATPVAWNDLPDRGLLVVNVDPAHMFSLVGVLPAGTEAWLVNHEGVYLGYLGDSEEKRSLYGMASRRQLSADYSPTEVTLIRAGGDGERILESHASIVSFATIQFDREEAAQRWTLLIGQPTAPLFAPVRRMTNLLWTIMGGTVLVAWIIGILVANYVMRPVTALRRATVEIAAGDLSRQVAISTGDEIEGLASDFNTMTTRLRVAQQRLAGWNEELQAEVARQTDRLRRLQTGLARADKLASIGQMAASIMHEIGNPLAAIKTKIQVAEEVNLCDECRQLLPELSWEVDRLSEVLRSFSRLGLLRQGQFEPVALPEVVDGVITLVTPDLKRRGVSLRAEADDGIPSIRGEPDHLRQLLINFILNAADASPEGGEILVRLRRIAGDGSGSERVEIAVRDHGTGISPDDLKLVWDPLFTTKADGTGLGLAICRQIVEEHGGSVVIRSRLDEGTVVTVTLPVTGD